MTISTTAPAEHDFAKIELFAAGASVLVEGVPGKKIRVLQCLLTSKGEVDVIWQSGDGSIKRTGPSYLYAGGGMVLPLSPIGWFVTLPGEALVVCLSKASPIGGHLDYEVI